VAGEAARRERRPDGQPSFPAGCPEATSARELTVVAWVASRAEAHAQGDAMTTQPSGQPQQTKKDFGQAFSKAWAKQPSQPSPQVVNAITTNPGQVKTVWGQAKSQSSQPQPAVGGASSAKGLTTVKLTQGQYQTYQQWTGWAQKYSVSIEEIFAGSPDFDTFTAFMAQLRQARESPPMGASQSQVNAAVKQLVTGYLSTHGVAAPSSTWGGSASTASAPQKEEKKPSKPEAAEGAAPWSAKQFTWTPAKNILKHKADLLASDDELPSTVEELVAFVQDRAADFKKKHGDVWQCAIGGAKTKTTGGMAEEKWWSVVVEVTGKDTGSIFHFGPEHLYKS
jgi:hypothetical protein